MPEIINVNEAKARFSRLLKRAHAGEEIVLAKALDAFVVERLW